MNRGKADHPIATDADAVRTGGRRAARIGRRAALLFGAATLSGCGTWDWISDKLDDWFGSAKKPLPGAREPALAVRNGLAASAADTRPVTVPPPVANPDWQQSGCNPTHVIGHPATPAAINEAWKHDIGEGGGYRNRLTAQPIVAGGRVYTMDSDAVVTALDFSTGAGIWTVATQTEDNRSTNLGGGLCFDGGTLYVTAGRGDLMAMDAGTGAIKWRRDVGTGLRSAPTYAGGKLFFQTIDDRLLAAFAADGKPAWQYQARAANPVMFGQAAPAYADGLVVGGFGSGEISAVSADTGLPAWSDSLSASTGRASQSDLPSVHGLIAIDRGQLFAISLAGLLVSMDLRTGRRLWERDVPGKNWPWVAGDWVYIISEQQGIAALHRDDGSVRWTAQLARYRNEQRQRDPIDWTGPVLTGGRLVAVSTDQKAVAINPLTGEQLGIKELPSPCYISPVVAGGTMLLLCDDGTLLALR